MGYFKTLKENKPQIDKSQEIVNSLFGNSPKLRELRDSYEKKVLSFLINLTSEFEDSISKIK